jgi:dolichol kinase
MQLDPASPALKKRHDVHLARKIWHFLGVVAIVAGYLAMSRQTALQVFAVVSALAIFADIYRQRSEWFNKIILTVLHPLMRDTEKNGLMGSTFLVLGVLIIIALFPPSVVVLSLLFLAVADPVASYFGIRFGKDKLFGRKSLQGSMAAFFACTVVAAGYFFFHDMMVERILIVSLLAGLVGAFAEAVPVGKLDDNLVLPVVSSILLWILYYFFGGF